MISSERALHGAALDPFKFDGDLDGLILVGRFCRFLQLATFAAGKTGRPEPRILSFHNARHTGENKSENKKFKKCQFNNRKSLRFNDGN